MKRPDKTPILEVRLRIRADVLQTANALSIYLDNAGLDHVFSEAIRDASKDRDAAKWIGDHPEALTLPDSKPKRGKPAAKGAAS